MSHSLWEYRIANLRFKHWPTFFFNFFFFPLIFFSFFVKHSSKNNLGSWQIYCFYRAKEISLYYSFTFQHLHLINNTWIGDKDWWVHNITKTWLTHSDVWPKRDLTLCSKHTWVCYFSGANSKCHRILFNLLLPVLALGTSVVISHVCYAPWKAVGLLAVGEWIGVWHLWWRLTQEQRKQVPGLDFFLPQGFSEMALAGGTRLICWLQLG